MGGRGGLRYAKFCCGAVGDPVRACGAASVLGEQWWISHAPSVTRKRQILNVGSPTARQLPALSEGAWWAWIWFCWKAARAHGGHDRSRVRRGNGEEEKREMQAERMCLPWSYFADRLFHRSRCILREPCLSGPISYTWLAVTSGLAGLNVDRPCGFRASAWSDIADLVAGTSWASGG